MGAFGGSRGWVAANPVAAAAAAADAWAGTGLGIWLIGEVLVHRRKSESTNWESPSTSFRVSQTNLGSLIKPASVTSR